MRRGQQANYDAYNQRYHRDRNQSYYQQVPPLPPQTPPVGTSLAVVPGLFFGMDPYQTIDGLEDANNDLHGEIYALQRSYDGLSAEHQKLKDLYEQLCTKNLELLAQVGRLTLDGDKTSAHFAATATKLVMTEARLEVANTENAELRKELHEMKQRELNRGIPCANDNSSLGSQLSTLPKASSPKNWGAIGDQRNNVKSSPVELRVPL